MVNGIFDNDCGKGLILSRNQAAKQLDENRFYDRIYEERALWH